MMRGRNLGFGLAMLMLVASGCNRAKDMQHPQWRAGGNPPTVVKLWGKHPRAYPVDDELSLRTEMDDAWDDRSDRRGPMRNIRFEARGAQKRMKILMTPMMTVDGRTPSDSEIRNVVDQAAGDAQSQSTEKIHLTAVKGDEVSGYQFHATDRAPKPGEYQYMYQGAVGTGAMLVSFTIFYNDGGEEHADAALATIRDLRVVPRVK